MKKLNKTLHFSYDPGKVLAYDAETSWILNGCASQTWWFGIRYEICDYTCEYNPFGRENCSIGSTWQCDTRFENCPYC